MTLPRQDSITDQAWSKRKRVLRAVGGGMRPYYYRYNAQGERIWWQTGTQADSYYAAERHLRSLDGRLIGTFDGDGVLQYWNIHAGGMSPIGRLTTEGNPPPPNWRVGDEAALGDSVRVAVQEAAPYEAREAIALALGGESE